MLNIAFRCPKHLDPHTLQCDLMQPVQHPWCGHQTPHYMSKQSRLSTKPMAGSSSAAWSQRVTCTLAWQCLVQLCWNPIGTAMCQQTLDAPQLLQLLHSQKTADIPPQQPHQRDERHHPLIPVGSCGHKATLAATSHLCTPSKMTHIWIGLLPHQPASTTIIRPAAPPASQYYNNVAALTAPG
jgi:hypothetical protein